MLDTKDPNDPNRFNIPADFADDDFDDDLHMPMKKSPNPMDPNFGDVDNFNFDHDANDLDLPSEEAIQPTPLNPHPSGSFLELVKTYGIVLLVFLFIGYFGIKYSFKAISNVKTAVNSAATNSTTAQNVNLGNPDAAKPLLPDQGVSPTADTINPNNKNYDPLSNVAKLAPVTPPPSAESAVLPASVAITSVPVTPAPSAPVVNTVSPQMQQDIENLKKALSDLTAQIAGDKDIQNKNSMDLKDQIQQLVIYIQGVGKGVGILSSEITQQQKVLEGLLAGVPVPRAGVNNNPVSINPNTVTQNDNVLVEAVISGRAWLKTSKNGTSLSVGVGDTIPGYGKVIEINQAKATITTDNGNEFKLN